MQIPDLINGSFELFGGLLLWKNVAQVLRDREIKGVHWLPTALFFLWGIWNLYYYPHLDQWFSFFGGLNIVAANGTWVGLVLKYRRGY